MLAGAAVTRSGPKIPLADETGKSGSYSVPPAGTPARSRRRTAALALLFSVATLVVVLGQGFLLTPVYLRHIPPALYGAWIAVGNIIAWVELADPGVSSLMQQRVATAMGKGDSRALGTAIGTGLALVLMFAVLPLAALPLAPFVAGWVQLASASAELAYAFQLGVCALSLSLLAYGIGAVNIGMQRVVATGALSLLGSGVAIIVTLVALGRGAGVAAIPIGLVARFALVLLGNILLLAAALASKALGPLAITRTEASQFGLLASYTGLAKLGTVAVNRVDAFMTANIVNPASATVLTLTTRLYDIVRFGSDRVAASSAAPLSHLAGEAGMHPARRVFDDIAVLVSCATGIGIGVALAFNRPFVGLWVGEHLYGGRGLTVASGAAVLGAVLGGLTTQVLFAVGGIRTGSWLPLAEAGLRLPLQYLMLRSIGIVGVPVASAISAAFMLAAAYPRAFNAAMGHGDYRAVIKRACGWAGALALPGLVAGLLLDRVAVRWSWPLLIGSAGLYCALMGGAVLATSARVRALVFAVSRRRQRAAPDDGCSPGNGAAAGVGR